MIEVSDLSKYYGDHPAIRDLAFSIRRGEVVGFLGLNGAGKSTTLKVLGCVLLPTSGRVTIDGFDVARDPHEIR
ncbi:MAG TPA: ATP-binding cassette domain-containing protein, partial [Acidimicrobiales bacterium]|nr:ATP-binding cassette domain-containing protein [Acidimicrobiales bacterium]